MSGDEPSPSPDGEREGDAPAAARRNDRPVFARSYPDDPRVDALVRAFVLGNYAGVREQARALEKEEAGLEVRRAARDLVSRTKADPVMIALLSIAAGLLVVLTAYWTIVRR